MCEGCARGVCGCVRACSCLDKEEVDEGLLRDEALVLLGEEALLEEQLGPPGLHPERLGAAVDGRADLVDLRVLVEQVVQAALHLARRGGRVCEGARGRVQGCARASKGVHGGAKGCAVCV